jgi:hypothetical protein
MKNELRKAHLTLARWRSRSEFVRLVEQWVVPANRKLVRGKGGNFLEEAWVLAQFLKLTDHVQRVRLSDPDVEWPDAFIEIGGMTRSVEVTEVMEPGRRPNDELPSTRLDPVVDWVERAKVIPDVLDEGIKRKAEKQYGAPVILIVYLNISIGFLRPGEHHIEQVIADAKVKYASHFEEIIVLWQSKLH